jgi:hypothetical protein
LDTGAELWLAPTGKNDFNIRCGKERQRGNDIPGFLRFSTFSFTSERVLGKLEGLLPEKALTKILHTSLFAKVIHFFVC